MKGDFYNTIDEEGEVLVKSREDVDKQEDLVLDFFRQHPRDSFIPPEVRDAILPLAPITSVRRAITNLTQDDYLEKTEEQKLGLWGKMNYKWRLARPTKGQGQLTLSFFERRSR